MIGDNVTITITITPQLIVLPIVDWATVSSSLTIETRGPLWSVGSPTIEQKRTKGGDFGRLIPPPAGQTLLGGAASRSASMYTQQMWMRYSPGVLHHGQDAPYIF